MRSYPFTSRVTYDEQGLPLYDRAVDSDFLRKVFAQYFSDGVFYDPTSSLQVTIDTGMNIKVLPGVCHIRGAIGIEETQRVLAVQASDSLDRIDTVVARLDLGLDVRSIDLYVRKGTAANTPVAPPLTRDNTVWELGLADIFVAKNTGTITQQRITDTRLDDTRCGVVAQTIGDLDTTPYFDQIQATLDDLRQTIQDVKSGDIVLSINGQRGDIVAGPELLSAAHEVHTHSKSQITDFAHTHPKSQITDFPASLPNPYALTLQLNGAANKTYNGSSAQTFNVTPGAIGAYTKSEIDQYVKYAVFGRSSDLVTSGYSGNFQFQDTRLGCYSHTASLASLNSSGMPVIKTAGKYLVIIRLYFVGQTSGIAINGLTIDTLLRRGSTSYSVGPTIIPGSWTVHAGGSVQFIANLNVNDYFTISYSCDPNAQKVTLNKTSAFYLIRLGA